MKITRVIAPAVSVIVSMAGMAAACQVVAETVTSHLETGAGASQTESRGIQRFAFGRGVASGALAGDALAGQVGVNIGMDVGVGIVLDSGHRPISPKTVRGAFDRIAAINPRVTTGPQCYSDNLTVEQLEYIMATYNALPPGQFLPGNAVPQYNSGTTVWTGNGGLGSGALAVKASLTYSFPPDGTMWGTPGSQQANQLSANLTTLLGATNLDQGREFIRQCYGSWRRYSGLTYTEVADSGMAMDNSPGRRSTIGDVRVGAISQGLTGVLAYNYFPNAGADATINSDYFSAAQGAFSNATNTYRYLRNVVTHEHGHGLGLGHQTPCNNSKLMEPFINTNFDMVALDDRRGTMRAYGDRFAGNSAATTAKNFGDLTTPILRSVIEKDLSTNGQWSAANPTGADWYRFTLSTAQTVSITVAPTGTSYPAADQTSGCNPTTGTTVNSLSAGNLAVTLNDAVGTSVLFSADASLNGGSELISAGTLAPGTYTVRVYDVGPNAVDDERVQTYNLTVRVGTAKATPAAFAGVNKRVLANTRCFFYGNLNSYANEGNVSAYSWDFNNDGVFELGGASLFRSYVTNGTFAATLRVTDTNGMTATDTINVVVTGATSAISTIAPSTGVQGAVVPVTITGTNFRGISAGSVTVVGGGVTVVGTPAVDYLGTTITGLSLAFAADAAAGSRDLRIVTTDGTVILAGSTTVQSCPIFTDGPFSITVPEAGTLTLTSTVGGTAAATLQWLQNGGPVNSAFATGTTGPTLSISPASLSDAGDYSLQATGPCGIVTSLAATVTVTPLPPVGGCNPADIVDGGGVPPGDGTVDGSDFIAFINAFSSEDPLADIWGNGGPGSDGIIDGSDFILFINSFAQGC